MVSRVAKDNATAFREPLAPFRRIPKPPRAPNPKFMRSDPVSAMGHKRHRRIATTTLLVSTGISGAFFLEAVNLLRGGPVSQKELTQYRRPKSGAPECCRF